MSVHEYLLDRNASSTEKTVEQSNDVTRHRLLGNKALSGVVTLIAAGSMIVGGLAFLSKSQAELKMTGDTPLIIMPKNNLANGGSNTLGQLIIKSQGFNSSIVKPGELIDAMKADGRIVVDGNNVSIDVPNHITIEHTSLLSQILSNP